MSTANLGTAIDHVRRLAGMYSGLIELADLLGKIQSLEAYTGELEVKRDKLIADNAALELQGGHALASLEAEMKEANARIVSATEQAAAVEKAAQDRVCAMLAEAEHDAIQLSEETMRGYAERISTAKEMLEDDQRQFAEFEKKLEDLRAQIAVVDAERAAAEASRDRVLAMISDMATAGRKG